VLRTVAVAAAAGALAVSAAQPHRHVLEGHSVDGRAIRAVELGVPGPRTVLVVGCIHGTECSGLAVVHALERRAQPRFDLWVVEDMNPDGYAAGSRLNGRGVDLNRNFPSEWRPLEHRWSPQYSGPRPLSEPETRFAARIIRRLRPAVTVWFHQHENRVRAWRQSIPAARRYARVSGMRFARVPWPAGSASNWQNHRFPDTASFVVELPAGQLSRAGIAAQVRAILSLGQ
jgi:murein peptide amidase A